MKLKQIYLKKSLLHWQGEGFKDVFKAEIEQLDVTYLPLQQGLAQSSYASDTCKIMILNMAETERTVLVKTGVFYTGTIAGCACEDDPTPTDVVNEHCEMLFTIDKANAKTAVVVVKDE